MTFPALAVALALTLPGAESLEGSWRVEQVVEDGRANPKTPDVVWTFTADKLEIYTSGKLSGSSPYTANTSTSPATLDVTLKGEKPGIYEISDGLLRVAVPEPVKGKDNRHYTDKREEAENRDPKELERPTSFGKHPLPVTVYIFRRVPDSTPLLPPVIGRPPPAPLPKAPKDGDPPAKPIDEAKKWPRIWRGNYFLPPSK